MTKHFRGRTPDKAHPLSARPAGFRRGGGKDCRLLHANVKYMKKRNQLIFNINYVNLQRHIFGFCSTDLALSEGMARRG